MRLEFDHLIVEGFKSFGRRTEFDLTRRPGLYRLRGRNLSNKRLGPNGAGKSTLWDAFLWVMFGKTVRGLRNPDVRPWVGAGPTEVTLSFRIDGHTHQLFRSASPNLIQFDGEEIMQEALERKLHLSFDVAVQTIVFGQQGRPLFFDLQPREKLALFTDVLDLDRWDARSKKADQKVTTLELEEAEYDGRLQELDMQLRAAADTRKQLTEASERWQAEQDARLAAAATARTTLERQLKAQERLEGGAQLGLDSARTEAKALRREEEQLREYLMHAQTELEVERGKLRAKKEKLRDLRELVKDLRDADTCPTCGQSITGTELGRHVAEARTQIKTLAIEVEGGVPSAAVDAVDDLQEQLDATLGHIAGFDEQAEQNEAALANYVPRVAELKTQLRAMATTRREREAEANPYAAQLIALRRQKVQIEDSIDSTVKLQNAIRKQTKRTAHWVKGFRDVKLYIIEEILQDLEFSTSAMLDELGLLGWRIQYRIEKETKSGSVTRGLNVSIISPDNPEPVRFESWSGGESQRLRLIGAMALADVLLAHAGVETSLMVFDEPTQHLSMEGIHDLIDLLAERARSRAAIIWFTDHRAIESSLFAGTITVTKDRNGSHLEEVGSDATRTTGLREDPRPAQQDTAGRAGVPAARAGLARSGRARVLRQPSRA